MLNFRQRKHPGLSTGVLGPFASLLLTLVVVGALAPRARAQQKEASLTQEPDRPTAELPEYVVLGSWSPEQVPQLPLEHPASRDVYGPQELRRMGARDLNDLVRNFPAMSTRPYNGGEAAAPSFSMRGLPDDGLTEYVHVLIDGSPANALPYGWTAFSFLPLSPERVYAVDLIRGGHTVRYSPNTVGGVLNFITEPVPAYGSRLRFQQWAGSDDFRSSSVSYATADGAGEGVRVRFTDRSGDGTRRDAPFDQKDLDVQLQTTLSDKTQLTTSMSWFETDHFAPGGLTRAEFDTDRWANARPENRFHGSRGAVNSVLHHQAHADSWGEVELALSATTRQLRAQRPHFGAASTLSDWTDESYFASLAARWEGVQEWGDLRHVLHAGLRVHREWLPSYRVTSEAYPGGGARTVLQDWGFRTTTFSAHLDDTVHLSDTVLAVVGVRAEYIPKTSGFDSVSGTHYEDSFSDLLPAASLSWRTSEHTALFANYNEGFRAPQVWGYAYSSSSKDALDFEQGRSYEVGGRIQEWRGIDLSVAAWRAEYDDFGVFYSAFYENLGAIDAQGIDLVLGFDAGVWNSTLDGIGGSISLTLQDSELQSGPNQGNETPYAWSEKAAWRFWWQANEFTEASLGGVHIGPSFSDDANTAAENPDGNLGKNASSTIWDARVAHELWIAEAATINLALGVANLFDTEWKVHSRGGFFGGGLVAGAPRQAYAMIEFLLEW